MKTFKEWLEVRDQEMLEEMNMPGWAKRAVATGALGLSLMNPFAGQTQAQEPAKKPTVARQYSGRIAPANPEYFKFSERYTDAAKRIAEGLSQNAESLIKKNGYDSASGSKAGLPDEIKFHVFYNPHVAKDPALNNEIKETVKEDMEVKAALKSGQSTLLSVASKNGKVIVVVTAPSAGARN